MADHIPTLPRRVFLGSLASAGGLALTGCSGDGPPTYGNILRMGDLLTYRAQRLVLPGRALVRQYEHSDITSFPAIGTTDPGDSRQPAFSVFNGEDYAALRARGFEDWRLNISGSVARPGDYSLADLKRFAPRTQITRHTCEEGWSAIGEWTGVPLGAVLQAVGILPSARYVQFHAYDEGADGIDLLDAFHPQTILAYGMNGRDLPVAHGAPLRVRVETQLGYKSIKYLRNLVVTDHFADHGRQGLIQNGWSWYAGI